MPFNKTANVTGGDIPLKNGGNPEVIALEIAKCLTGGDTDLGAILNMLPKGEPLPAAPKETAPADSPQSSAKK